MIVDEIVREISQEKSLRDSVFMAQQQGHLLAPTIFHERWWMELASSGAYQEVTVSSGGRLAGQLAFVKLSSIPGFSRIGMPLMTHVLGPAIAPEFTDDSFPRSLKQISVIRDLIAQLPKTACASFRLHGGITDTLAFGEAGFSTSVDFTVEIMPRSTHDLWRQLRSKTRNVIRRAQESLTINELLDAETFVNFYEKNLADRRLVNHYDRNISISIIMECLRRGRGRVIAALDREGTLQSAIFTVWDQQTEYYFMSTRTVRSMNGATSLLIWHALQHSAQNDRRFDMDMVHVQKKRLPNLRLLTGFGGEIKPRYFVRRTSAMVKLASVIRNLV